MKLLSRFYSVLILSFVIISCSSPSDSGKNELEKGKFEVKTTGAVEKEFSGTAKFSINPHPNFDIEIFTLSLDAGRIPIAPDNVIGNRWGIFLFPENDSSNVLTVENSPLVSWYVIPKGYEFNYPDEATITIEERSPELVTGTILIKDSINETEEVKITGRFKANKFE